MINTSRRSFLTGLGASLITAPAIVRAASIMPVKPIHDFEFWRYDIPTGAVYGRSPAMMVLDDLVMMPVRILPDHITYRVERQFWHMHLTEEDWKRGMQMLRESDATGWAGFPGRERRSS